MAPKRHRRTFTLEQCEAKTLLSALPAIGLAHAAASIARIEPTSVAPTSAQPAVNPTFAAQTSIGPTFVSLPLPAPRRCRYSPADQRP